MAEIRWEIVPVLAANSLNVSKTAEQLALHKTTVKYHADRIFDRTGLDPTKFYDLVMLLVIISNLDNAEWQEARMQVANIDKKTMDALMHLMDHRYQEAKI